MNDEAGVVDLGIATVDDVAFEIDLDEIRGGHIIVEQPREISSESKEWEATPLPAHSLA